MADKLEQVLVKALAKKKGIKDEEAAVYVEALEEELGEDGLQKWMANLSNNADVISKMPNDVQKDLIGLMATRIGNEGSSRKSDPGDLAVRIAAVREAFKDEKPEKPETDPELKEKIEELMATVNTLKEEKAKKELDEIKEALNDRLEAIEQKLTSGGAPGTVEDEIERLAKDAEKLNIKQTTLKKLLGIPEASPEATLSTDSARKHLETLGYKVEGPKTVAELEKEFTARLESKFKEAKEEAKKEMKAEERRLEILADIGGSIIETVIPVMGRGGGQKALSATAAALKSAAASGA